MSQSHLQDTFDKKKFNDIYNLKIALRGCIVVDKNFLEDAKFKLELTNQGQELFVFLKEKTDFADEIIYVIIFFEFYHDDLYIEINDSNCDYLIAFLNDAIINEKIKFPWIFGKDLYDKYYDEFDDQNDDLDYNDTLKLLEGTSKGVFQIDNLIISPFGIVWSKEQRSIWPSNEVYLWHCSDPSCPTFHKAKLSNYEDERLEELQYEIENYIYDNGKELVDISDYFFEKEQDYFDPYLIDGLYELIANAFGEKELKQIATRLFKKENIRNLFPQEIRKGSTEDVLNKLNKSACFSLILLYEDKLIFQSLEELIQEGIIYIPNTEIRQSYILKEFGYYDTFLQCNKLGLRVNSNYLELSISKLKKLIKDIYNISDLNGSLEWILRKYNNSLTLDQKLDLYINDNTPDSVVKETILKGHIQLKKAAELLHSEFDSTEDEDKIINTIVWKLGFDINIYPSHLSIFWSNLERFKKDVLFSNKYNESDKSKIRSSAVNLFVSIEEILEQALSYTAWVLLSDHYLHTKFKYVYEDSRDFMVCELDNFEYTDGEYLRLDTSGKNTLFPLVNGFSALIKKCKKILEEKGKNIRLSNQFPSFYSNDPLVNFPFEHTRAFLDMLESDFNNFCDLIETIPVEFGKGKIMDIRNRLQHKREDFPRQDEMTNAIESIEKCFSIIENNGIYPVVYLFKQSFSDQYNRSNAILQNYKGNEVTLPNSLEFRGSYLPNYGKPLLIIQSLKMGGTNHPYRFQYQEKSEYQSYWKNYPRKKYKKNNEE